MKKKKVALVVCLSFFSSLSLADSASWNGFYAGGNLGYGWGSSHDTGNPHATKQSLEGFSGGVQAGYNWQFKNNVVLGIEAGLSFNDIKESWKDRDNNQFSPYYGKNSIASSVSLNVKAGYAIDKFLPYVTLGVTAARTEYSLGCDKSLVRQTNGCQRAEYHTSSKDTAVGANVGLGLMYKFTENLSAGVEYLYTDLGSRSVRLSDPNYPSKEERHFKNDYSTMTIKINYHF